MNRHPIATHARALSGAAAFVCLGASMTLVLSRFTQADPRCPGEGTAASP